MNNKTLVQIQIRKKGSNAAADCIFMAQNAFTDCRSDEFKGWLEATLYAAREQYTYVDESEYHYVVYLEGAPMFLGVEEQ